ncbi:heme-degrading domain-containing protein [Arsenicitalea aurantiaca]|uniref:UPF0303 protein EMQ25_04270 n=1 Tax=Arsenicitalea aurantiaca TaxID=1783274 RepID=A0A433XM57_9HYPH|nr:heme-degrading domain-containing protein [Arsenicitalea aurantiaca]RUT35167.1 heme-degrading domain-containing protein [Arsenicitalea aurantiaca]
MAVADDISTIIRQEQELVFERFDEATAFAIGSHIRERALADGLTLVADVRLWDRPLFYCAMPGTTADNPVWVRRKANSVQRLGRSSYRLVLENPGEERVFPVRRALDPNDYALAGGGFPIRVAGIGIVGAATVSGLPEREDHNVVVAAICHVLGKPYADYALPRPA